MTTVKSGEEFQVSLALFNEAGSDTADFCIAVEGKDLQASAKRTLEDFDKKKFDWATPINFYFGGKRPAPHTMFVYRTRKPKKL